MTLESEPGPGTDVAAPREDPGRLGFDRFFIVGYPRSGTTWLMWLLAQHPEVAAVKQSGLFHQLRPLYRWWERDHKYTKGPGRAPVVEDQPRAVYETRNTKDLFREGEFFEAIRPFCDHVYGRMLAETPGARMVVEQTPENLRQTDLVQGIYPDARFLHVVRDPRAVFSSMRSAARSWSGPSGFPRHPVPIARIWNEFMARGRALAEDPRRCLQIRYEDLLEDGPARLLEVHRWMGLESGPEACEKAVAACEIDKLRSRTKSPEGFFRRGSAGGWREDVSRSELRTLEHLAGEEMARWGYERVTPAGGKEPLAVRLYDLAARAVAWSGRSRWLEPFRRLRTRAARSAEIMAHQQPGWTPK